MLSYQKNPDSTEVGNYARNLSSTVESKTSASEHCNAQETGISDDKSEGTCIAKPHTECLTSVLPDNEPNSTLHVATKTEVAPSSESGLNDGTDIVSYSIDQCTTPTGPKG